MDRSSLDTIIIFFSSLCHKLRVIMKIYTKTGDKGATSLYSGERVEKYSLRVETYGTIDELNSVIGLAISFCDNPDIKNDLIAISNDLFSLCADFANTTINSNSSMINENHILNLENLIDKYTAVLPPLSKFILPGGTKSASFLHQARSVSRRAERLAVKLSSLEQVSEVGLIYLNRLSDFLFTVARMANYYENQTDIFWEK